MNFQSLDQTTDEYPVPTYSFTTIAPPSFPSRPGSSVLIDCRSEGSLTVDNYPHYWTSSGTCSRCPRQLIIFDMIPDDVLLEIFSLYVDEEVGEESKPIIEEWITLFLGGFAPRLRSLYLRYLPFPGLPKLLLSATHLVRLNLAFIPRSGYIPPEVMATSLSALTSLESLWLCFDYPPPRPAIETRRPPLHPLTRSILSSLATIRFRGASEYLEVILARIDTPRLDLLHLTFFSQLIFDTPQLSQFISRSQKPTLRAPKKANIKFRTTFIAVTFPSQTSDHDSLTIQILTTPPEWQLSSLEQVCTSTLPPVSTLEDLHISEPPYDRPDWQDDVENSLWLDLLRSFVAVKNLYISVNFVPRIAPALQELVGGRATEVLPALENIFLEGFQPYRPLKEGIEKFVAARMLISRPVAVSRWDKEES